MHPSSRVSARRCALPLRDGLKDLGNQLLACGTIHVRHQRDNDSLRRPQIEKRARARLTAIIPDALGTQRVRIADEPSEAVKLELALV